MCVCRPNVRTPFCGRLGCEWPKKKEKIVRDNTIFCCSNCGKGCSIFDTDFEGCCSSGCLSNLSRREEKRRIVAKLRSDAHRARAEGFNANAFAWGDYADKLEKEQDP